MNKDAVLASVIGFAIGLCITGFLLVGPNILKNLPQISLPKRQLPPSEQAAKTNDDEAKTSQAGFHVTEPTGDTIVSDSSLAVSGTAEPGSVVVVQSFQEETVATTNAEGKFTSTVEIEEGKTDVLVTNYINGKPTVVTIPVFYTQEKQ